MKFANISSTLLLFVTVASAVDTPPPELVAAHTRYDTAVTTAIKPIRERYVLELQQLKSRAMSLKQLDLAVAIDEEIKTLGDTNSTGTATLKARLSESDTKWTWEDFQGGTSVIHFTKDGKFHHPGFGGTWKVTAPKTVIIETSIGKATVKFNDDFTTYQGTDFSGVKPLKGHLLK